MTDTRKIPAVASPHTAAEPKTPNAPNAALTAANSAAMVQLMVSSASSNGNSAQGVQQQIGTLGDEMKGLASQLKQLQSALSTAQQQLSVSQKNQRALQPRPPQSGSFASPQAFDKALASFNKKNPDYAAQSTAAGHAVQAASALVGSLQGQINSTTQQLTQVKAAQDGLKRVELPNAQARDQQTQRQAQQQGQAKHPSPKQDHPQAQQSREQRAGTWQQNFAHGIGKAPADLSALSAENEPLGKKRDG
jgi:septal ring factor EnvC (AmiA/AmiB activator)